MVVRVVRNLNLTALNQRAERVNIILKTHVRGVNKESQTRIRALRELSVAANRLGASAIINRPRNILSFTHKSVTYARPLTWLINRVAGDGLGR